MRLKRALHIWGAALSWKTTQKISRRYLQYEMTTTTYFLTLTTELDLTGNFFPISSLCFDNTWFCILQSQSSFQTVLTIDHRSLSSQKWQQMASRQTIIWINSPGRRRLRVRKVPSHPASPSWPRTPLLLTPPTSQMPRWCRSGCARPRASLT